MRVAVLDTVYPAFVRSLYENHEGLAEQPYEAQLRVLLDFSFGTSDAYTEGLRKLGHEAWNLITNVLPLQAAWLRRERLRRLVRATDAVPWRPGVGVRHYTFQAIAAAQIDAINPDVVFVHDVPSIERWLLRRWRRQGRFLVGQFASPLPPLEHFQPFDLMLSSFHHFVDRFRAAGIDAEFFRLGFYEKVLQRLRAQGVSAEPDSTRSYAVVFIGGVDPSTHGAGTRLLEAAATELPLELWGYGHDFLSRGSPIRSRWRGEAWGLQMYRILANARIVLNRHIDVAEGQANNMRLYEATGSGALLLTDAGRGLDELFEVDHEVMTYESADDLVEKARYLLAHDGERIRIATAGQQRTLREHTYDERMRELATLIQQRRSTIASSHSPYASTIALSP